jgi:hypothetical protein
VCTLFWWIQSSNYPGNIPTTLLQIDPVCQKDHQDYDYVRFFFDNALSQRERFPLIPLNSGVVSCSFSTTRTFTITSHITKKAKTNIIPS